jgi:hypothetical protein
MDEEENSRSIWKFLRTLINLVVVAFAVILAITIYNHTSDMTQAALVGSFCTLGMVVTVVMLLVLVHQSHGRD